MVKLIFGDENSRAVLTAQSCAVQPNFLSCLVVIIQQHLTASMLTLHTLGGKIAFVLSTYSHLKYFGQLQVVAEARLFVIY